MLLPQKLLKGIKYCQLRRPPWWAAFVPPAIQTRSTAARGIDLGQRRLVRVDQEPIVVHRNNIMKETMQGCNIMTSTLLVLRFNLKPVHWPRSACWDRVLGPFAANMHLVSHQHYDERREVSFSSSIRQLPRPGHHDPASWRNVAAGQASRASALQQDWADQCHFWHS